MKRIELPAKRLEGVCSNPLSYMGKGGLFHELSRKFQDLLTFKNKKYFYHH
jgi:hypothetical protein